MDFRPSLNLLSALLTLGLLGAGVVMVIKGKNVYYKAASVLAVVAISVMAWTWMYVGSWASGVK